MPAQTPDTPEFYQKRLRPMRHTRSIVLLLLLAAPAAALACTHERQLANGLRVIVKEDRRAPTVAHMVWYRAGGMDETNGTTGVAHVLEHMMFKGTPSVGPGEFNRRVAAAGGRDNAFTSRDYTAYFQQVPKEKLSEMMQLEADRMRHLTLDAHEFAQEIRVVMEERRLRTDDQPQSLLFEHLAAVAFQAHPYRVPVIGWMSDLENMTVADARFWYEQLVCAEQCLRGGCRRRRSSGGVRSLPNEHYGPLVSALVARQKAAGRVRRSSGIRRLSRQGTGRLAAGDDGLQSAGHSPCRRGCRPLCAGNSVGSSRRPRRSALHDEHLVRRQQSGREGGGQLMIRLHAVRESSICTRSPSEGKSRSANSKPDLRAEIAAVQDRGVAADELARAKAQLIAGQIYKLDSMFAQAMEIGQLEAVGIPSHDEAAHARKAAGSDCRSGPGGCPKRYFP
jgi:zinc protease